MIAIVDYGMGNLRSVQKALERVGAQAAITSDPTDVRRAEKLVVPGVGAFADTMAGLHQHGMVEPIRDAIRADTPYLGICMGLQVLFSMSYEGGEHRGLDVIPGEVVRLRDCSEYKVPHMGWNRIEARKAVKLLQDLPEAPYVYFVHSYHVCPQDASVVAAETDYGGWFTSMISRGNLFATQFHPEKSQRIGLEILRRFVEL
jgi:glutamine amidotransferase